MTSCWNFWRESVIVHLTSNMEAHKKRVYREKLKNNPTKYQRQLDRNAAEARAYRQRKKETATENEIERRRAYERERKRLQREKKRPAEKIKLNFNKTPGNSRHWSSLERVKYTYMYIALQVVHT